MAAESAEMAAMLTANAPRRGNGNTKWFGLAAASRSRNTATAAPPAPPPPAVPLRVARPPMAAPAPRPAAPTAQPPILARPHTPTPAAAPPPDAALSVAGMAPAQMQPADMQPAEEPIASGPELYGPPPPPAAMASPPPSPPAAVAPPSITPPSIALQEHPEPPAEAPVAAAPVATAGPPLVIATAHAARPRFFWLLASFGWLLRLAVIVALIAGSLALAVWPAWRDSQRIDVEILPIAVPAELAARGLDPEVMAGRLLDALEAIAAKTADNARNRPSKDELGFIPAIAVTPDRLTLRSLASLLRELRGLPLRRIAGEVTAGADNRLAVRLRVPGGGLIATAEGAPGEDADTVFAALAADVWRRLNPLIYAWHVADGGGSEEVIRPKLVSLAQDIRLPPMVEFRVSVLYVRSLVRSGRAEEALATIEALERRGATYPLLWNVKAQALADLGRAEAALDAQKQAVVQEGTTVWSHISSAHLLMKLGKPREALTDLQSARRLSPNNFDAVMLEGLVLLNIGRPAEALALIGRVIDARPNLPGVQEALGNALLANNRPDEAIAAFDLEIARNPNSVTTRLARANALRALRRPEEALATIEAILRIAPRDGMATAMRGWTLLDLGRTEQALGVFDLLLKDKPDDPLPLYGKGMTLAALGRRPEAIGALARVVELQPANRRAAADLARLRGVAPPGARPPAAPAPGTAPAQAAPVPTPPARQ